MNIVFVLVNISTYLLFSKKCQFVLVIRDCPMCGSERVARVVEEVVEAGGACEAARVREGTTAPAAARARAPSRPVPL